VCDPIDEETVETVNSWLAARTWPQESQWLIEHVADERIGKLRHRVEVAAALFPEQPAVAQLANLLGQVERGELNIDEFRQERNAEWQVNDLVARWLGTSSWNDTHRILTEHREVLGSPAVRSVLRQLAGTDEFAQVAEQHLAILNLLALDADEHDVFEWLVNPFAVQRRVIDALEDGELPLLRPLLAINPAANGHPPHGWLISWLRVVLDPHARAAVADAGTTPATTIAPAIADLGPDVRHAARLHVEAFLPHLDGQERTATLRADTQELIEALR
jgi:hypothetical protein